MVSFSEGRRAQQEARRDAEDEDGGGDHQGARPGQMLPALVGAHGELEDHHRQVGDGLGHVRAAELVVQGSEQERRGLAADARDARITPVSMPASEARCTM